MVKLQLAILSFACCKPQLAVHDKRYVDVIKEAAERAGIEYELDLVHASEARMTQSYNYMGEIMPLFNKLHDGVGPALFINYSLQLYGGVPTVERLTETFEKAKVAVEQGRL
ncbi:MAG: hypothetical protein GX307_08540 [Euryarchaeota archaeon]|jgi:hypothetical protein|nr:hypothetical protein [Euryarchaeota archaeon]